MNDFRNKITELVETGVINVSDLDTTDLGDLNVLEPKVTCVCIICGESTGNRWDTVCPKCKQAVMFIREQIENNEKHL